MALKTRGPTCANDRKGLALTLLGTHGGPPVYPDRYGISSALVVDGTAYVVDCGRGSVSQYVKAGLRFSDLESIFITHQHADHLADYFSFLMLPSVAPTLDGDRLGHVDVYGPGPAGGLPERLTSPTDVEFGPAPGIREATERMYSAFAYSSNIFRSESGAPDYRAGATVHEIVIPPETGASFERTSPSMTPFTVMEDDRVRVTATLVPHGPVFPAFAYRFDTEYGSVTFSGDSARSDNLVELARNTDILVHEAVNMLGADIDPGLETHMLQTHTAVQDTGRIAAEAGAGHLVLSHIADLGSEPLDERQWTAWASSGFDGPVDIGADLDTFQLTHPRARTARA